MAETRPIVVINPNSTEAVTRGIEASVAPLRLESGPAIDCVTLAEGPPGIETQEQSDAVVAPLCRLIREREAASRAFVIACFSDPGLHAAREQTRKPVLGIAESAMVTALTRAERFGILSILEGSIPRHARMVRAAGLSERFAGDVAIGVGVTKLGGDDVLDRLSRAGRELVATHGAGAVILGCAGLAHHRASLEDALAVPVIEPCQAAVTLALGAALLAQA